MKGGNGPTADPLPIPGEGEKGRIDIFSPPNPSLALPPAAKDLPKGWERISAQGRHAREGKRAGRVLPYCKKNAPAGTRTLNLEFRRFALFH